MLSIDPEGRTEFFWPFYGVDTEIPDIKVGTGSWVPLTAAPSYVPNPAVTGSPLWFMALIAGPDATSNPVGTIVLSRGVSQIKFRVTDNPEVDIPTEQTWIQVTR